MSVDTPCLAKFAQSLGRITRLMVPHVSVDTQCFAKVHYSLTELFDTWFPMCRWTVYVRQNCTKSCQDYSINGTTCGCRHSMFGKIGTLIFGRTLDILHSICLRHPMPCVRHKNLGRIIRSMVFDASVTLYAWQKAQTSCQDYSI